MPYSKGIHGHPIRKLGRKPPRVGAPALHAIDYLTGKTPQHPAAVDHLKRDGLTFGLYRNDTFGDCGPTMCCNVIRGVSTWLTGTMVEPTDDQCLAFYTLNNPDFDPLHPNADGTYPGDSGVVLQDMLGLWVKEGIDTPAGNVKILGFAKVDVSDDNAMDAALSVFGFGCLGVNLELAQQDQSDRQPIVWDAAAPHSEWGGHAITGGRYAEAQDRMGVITWAEEADLTDSFRRRQLDEFWVVILPWHLESPGFQEGVDLASFAADYEAITGRPFPAQVPPPTPTPDPAPVPTPVPVPDPTPTPPEPRSGCLQLGPFSARTRRRLASAAQAKGYDDVEAWLTHVIKYGGVMP